MFGASGAAMLVPGTIACALAALATQTLKSVGAAVDRILPLTPPTSNHATTPLAVMGLLHR